MYSQYRQWASDTPSQQTEMAWNGSSWTPVVAGSNPNQPGSNTTSCYQSQWQQQQQPRAPQPAPPVTQSLVQKYTNYYHTYTKQVKYWEQQLHSSPAAEAHHKWVKYQADEASRAAHFFHQNPLATSAPFPLPPEPTPLPNTDSREEHQQATNQNVNLFSSSSSYSSRLKNHQTTPQQPSTDETPASLQHFVDQCLVQCKNQMEKDQVMKEIQKLIQQAILAGTLASKEWNRVPLVQPSRISNQQQQQQPKHQGVNYSYSRPPHATAAAGSPVKKSGTSYYGPSAPTVSTTTRSPPHQISTLQNNTQQQQNYYGPTESQDFIAIPASPKNKRSSKKKRKFERKDSGFNQSSGALSDRAKRFTGPGGIAEASSTPKNIVGFDKYMGKGMIGGDRQLTADDYEYMTCKGSCQQLEKGYLRLTAPPRPELVRPQVVLEKHLANLKRERTEQTTRRDYEWFCSQLKAVRQDCTVQRIQNAFAIDVYETHARIALEEGDLNEYNQCQTQLKELYRLLRSDEKALQNRIEFLAYRLIYYVFLTGNEKYSGGSSDLFSLMLSLTASERDTPEIQHALQVREAVADTDYHKFFRLRATCPNLGIHLMDSMVPTMRYKGLRRICQAYRPNVQVEFVLKELALSENGKLESGLHWLVSCGCVLNEDRTEIVAKSSVIHESDLDSKKSLI